MPAHRPVMLVILDGWGWREEAADNAVRQARTPAFDRLWQSSPHAFLRTSGRDVGLPDGQMGNSEVGHLNIGAGRVVVQDLPRINEATRTDTLAESLGRSGLVDALRASGGTCHLLGLISPGGVHSHQDHAAALAALLTRAGVPTVVHAFTDGRDTPPRSAAEYLAAFGAALPPDVPIATICGRYYAMDRDKRWERVEKAYKAVADGEGARFATAEAAIADALFPRHRRRVRRPGRDGRVRRHEGRRRAPVVQLPRRPRARDPRRPARSGFFRLPAPPPIRFAAAAGMTQYSDELDALLKTLFPPQNLKSILGEVVAAAGRTQLRMAETEKYPHVTYFLNGGEETPYPGEERIMVPSPKVATYDLQPEMSAPELTDKAVAAIRSGRFDLIVLNYANPDMVGHTGSLPAAIKAVETVDAGLGRIADAVREAGGALLVTADHGNCELMRDPATGGPHTAHTTNPVPVLLMGGEAESLADGRLADIAPTLLALMGLPKPAEMSGASLLCPIPRGQKP